MSTSEEIIFINSILTQLDKNIIQKGNSRQ